MTQRGRGARLWYFRTPNGVYVLHRKKPTPEFMESLDRFYKTNSTAKQHGRPPRGLPSLNPGSCIPVAVSEKGASDG